MKGGSSGGAADYGVYVWGTNQIGGQEGNLIQPVHDPRLFGQLNPQGTQGVTGGGRRRCGFKGGFAASTISPAPVNMGGMLNESNISELAAGSATDQMNRMTTPIIPSVSTDSANPAAATTPTVTGGKKRRRTRKKIYSKNKRHNGRRKRRTSKIR
jgi:hypothetical protein